MSFQTAMNSTTGEIKGASAEVSPPVRALCATSEHALDGITGITVTVHLMHDSKSYADTLNAPSP
jgi:hypothetical protein